MNGLFMWFNVAWHFSSYGIFQIEQGEIKPDEFDHVVLNLDLLLEASLMKKSLKDRFPSKKKGSLLVFYNNFISTKQAVLRITSCLHKYSCFSISLCVYTAFAFMWYPHTAFKINLRLLTAFAPFGIYDTYGYSIYTLAYMGLQRL